MLKKLMSFLFEEEEEEVYSDDELEEAIFKDVPTPAPQPKMKPQPKVETSQQVSFAHPKPSRAMEPQQVQPKQEPRKFTSIDLEPKKEQAKTQPVAKHRPIVADGPTPVRAEKPKSEFNVAPIISPIFGSGEENETKNQPITATGTTRKKKTIGVISPIYGTETLGEESAARPIEKRHAALPKEESLEIKKPEEEKLVNIPLEDIIKKDEDVEDDSMQISLFGEDTPIHKDTTADYKIEE